jgi:L-rhamnose isomerase
MGMSTSGFKIAQEQYAAVGVDVESALVRLDRTPVSLHCWQGDDVTGFESCAVGGAGGGCVATGNYPGKARTPDELRADLQFAGALIPGPLRLNLHASYASDSRPSPERDELRIEHYQSWIDWVAERQWGFDFNPTCFSHRLADDGFTLSHGDPGIRRFWIAHCVACRKIAAAIGERLQNPVITNLWIPDGFKDTPADRFGPRDRLAQSLDAIFGEPVDRRWNLDTVEAKLFGIGVESYTVGSHEFYLGYATSRQIGLCLDTGHFHPTESTADKLSSVLSFVPHVLLHVSRGVRWDSDHVVTMDEATESLLEEAATAPEPDRIRIGLDFFDASINRIAAWVIGARNAKRALLRGLLQPTSACRRAEASGDFTSRLALQEDARSLPWGWVWEEYCARYDVPADGGWLGKVKSDEATRLQSRGGWDSAADSIARRCSAL